MQVDIFAEQLRIFATVMNNGEADRNKCDLY